LLRNSTVSSVAALHQPYVPVQPVSTGLLVDVVVLSADAVLYEAIRNSIGERNPVWRARSAEESVDLLLTGRCGVLVIDMGSLSTEPSTFIEQIVAQFPDVVAVVAGRREDEALLGRLVSDGLVYRFMHKPLSAKRAGMFLGASIRHHVERREHRVPESLLPRVARFPSRAESRKWSLAAGGLGLLVALLAMLLGVLGRDEMRRPEATGSPPVANDRDAAGPRADPVLSRARAAHAGGRYESPAGRNALDLYAAVLLANPGHPEARAGLDDTIASIVAMADAAAAKGRATDARRLLERLRAVEPESPAVSALARRLQPPVAAAPSPTAAIAVPAPVPAPDAAPRKVVVAPDPLTPRIVNADQLRRRPLLAPSPHGPHDAFGPPLVTGHPVAGYVDEPPVVEGPPLPVETRAYARTGAGSEPLPIDDFRPLSVSDPFYPPQALRSGIEGWVELEFTITETGVVRDVAVVDAEPRGVFDAAAAEAVGAWRFEPRFVNGRPVAQRSLVTLRFNVDD
jgi:protein TonB